MKFFFAFLGVLCALALARDENTKVLKAAAASTSATWNDAVLRTNLKSTLFETCVTPVNTRKMQYFYIQDPAQGIEFMKYEVNRFEKGFRPVNWEREIQCKDILDCSQAAKDYLMFQYNGTTCRMVNRTYLNTEGQFFDEFEGYEKDVVYVNTAATPSGCPVNTDVLVVDSGTKCIGGTTLEVPTTKIMASSSCIKHYGGSIYSGSGSVPFTTIRDFLKNKKYQGNIYIHATYEPYFEAYLWKNSMDKADGYFAVKPQEPRFQQLVVISSSHDYLLIGLNTSDLVTGFLCLGDPSG